MGVVAIRRNRRKSECCPLRAFQDQVLVAHRDVVDATGVESVVNRPRLDRAALEDPFNSPYN